MTNPATTRKGIGGWTLLLALTLSVQAAAMTSAMPAHRPAMVDAVVRFLTQVAQDAHARDDRRLADSSSFATSDRDRTAKSERCSRVGSDSILIELLNLPPPTRG